MQYLYAFLLLQIIKGLKFNKYACLFNVSKIKIMVQTNKIKQLKKQHLKKVLNWYIQMLNNKVK